MQPHNYTFELQAMTSEKMEFTLPGVFTIGPKVRTLHSVISLFDRE